MDLKDLTEEQKEKARNCKTPEDVLALAQAEGIELSDDEIEGVAGGSWYSDHPDGGYVEDRLDPTHGDNYDTM